MRKIAALAFALFLAGCQTPEPKIVTKDVNVAVPVNCNPKITLPASHIMTRNELSAALAKAPNVTEKARIVSDQLLLWMGYGPQLEAGIKACAGAK